MAVKIKNAQTVYSSKLFTKKQTSFLINQEEKRKVFAQLEFPSVLVTNKHACSMAT